MKQDVKTSQHDVILSRVRSSLYQLGVKSKVMPRSWCSFDLLANGGVRVGVKSAETRKRSGNSFCWQFNLRQQSTGLVDGTDFFVLTIPPLVEFGFRNRTYLVVPAAKVGASKTISISPKTLALVWGEFVGRWDLIRDFKLASNGKAKT